MMGTELVVYIAKTMGMLVVVATVRARVMGMGARVRVWVLGMMEHLRAEAQGN
jgi:hypothetical protein